MSLFVPESKSLSTNINLHLIPVKKFKTVLIAVFIQQELEMETAAVTALLPAVLERGTKSCPTYRDLKIRLEELYGAGLSSDVFKMGERQILAFSLEIIHDKFAPGEDLLQQGVDILKNVITEPFLERDVFKSEYVEQEKEQLAKEIQGLVNDKVNYALERCIQNMCDLERYGVYKYGRVEDLGAITPESLYGHYQSLLGTKPVDIFVIGEVDPKATAAMIEDAFRFPRHNTLTPLPEVETGNIPGETRYWEERLPVNQGKLTLGYRTNILYGDERFPALLYYNGILGGFPHSKLFQNVREKASLAYYAFSRLEKHKGIQLIGSGIEAENYLQAREIIEEQVKSIQNGEITVEEMDNTKKGLINQFKIIGDNPSSLLAYYLDGIVGKSEERVESLTSKIEKIKVADVVEIAREVALDSVYFLYSTDSAENEGSE